jgi:SAM-dependent methyltransferase
VGCGYGFTVLRQAPRLREILGNLTCEQIGTVEFATRIEDLLCAEPAESVPRWETQAPPNVTTSGQENAMSAGEVGPDADSVVAGQREHWQVILQGNPQIYGPDPSEPGRYAVERFTAEQLSRVLELGAGQGRDTLGLLRAGLAVTALDFAAGPLDGIAASAGPQLARRLGRVVGDVRQPLPFSDASFDACYSHMLFTMALSSDELVALAREVRRVLRPGGLCIYTVRHTGDAHYGTGHALGDNLYENGGFVVHFFDRALVDRLADGFTLEDLTGLEEGDLPRRLWRITMRRP